MKRTSGMPIKINLHITVNCWFCLKYGTGTAFSFCFKWQDPINTCLVNINKKRPPESSVHRKRHIPGGPGRLHVHRHIYVFCGLDQLWTICRLKSPWRAERRKHNCRWLARKKPCGSVGPAHQCMPVPWQRVQGSQGSMRIRLKNSQGLERWLGR